MSQNQKKIQKELEKIYDNHYQWLEMGKILRKKTNDKFDNSLEKHPLLKKILILGVSANIGIYSLLIMWLIYWK